MSSRAVILGLLMAALIAATDYLNWQVWGLPSMIENHMPRGLFGLLVLAAILLNPLLGRLKRGLSLQPAELAVILALMLASGGVAGNALVRHFQSTLALPAHYNVSSPGWRKHDLLGFVPPAMFPAQGRHDSQVLSLVEGLGRAGHPIGLGQVPWSQWEAPLLLWMPYVLLMGLSVVCLSLIVHQQWAHHERLRYPIADFARGLIDQAPGQAWPRIARSRLFWIGFGALLLVQVINGLNARFPQYVFVNIPLSLDFSALLTRFPGLTRAPWTNYLYRPTLVPMAIAFTYFLAGDVGFTLGFSHILFVLIVDLVFFNLGLDIRRQGGGDMAADATAFVRFGAAVAMALMLVYLGRRYYWQALRSGMGLSCTREVSPGTGWAVRGLAASVAAMTWLLSAQGLNWPFALMVVGLLLLIFLVVARVNAETGLYWFRISMMPAGLMLAAMGNLALGPQALIILGIVSTVSLTWSEGSFMPFVVNGLKIADDAGVQPVRMGRGILWSFALCLVVAIPIALWAGYNYGTKLNSWETGRLPVATFKLAEKLATELNVTGQLEPSRALTTWERFAHMQPSRSFIYASTAGFGLVMLLSVLRLRLTWWPLHPALMVFWGTWPLAYLGVSFLLGWLIKVAVTGLGGGQTYHRVKAMMIGIIAGDLLGELLLSVVTATSKLVAAGAAP